MTDAVGELKEQVQEQRPKILFGVAVATVFLVMSLAATAITAWMILSGDPGTAARNTLPSDCDWVLESHESTDPIALLVRFRGAGLPHPASQLIALVDADMPTLGDGIDLPAGAAVCGRKGAVLFSLGLHDATAIRDIKELVPQSGATWVATEPVGGFTELWLARGKRKVAAILHTDKRAVLAITPDNQDASAILAEVVAATRKASLRDATGFREGMERVGGTVRLWLSADLARRWVDRPWSEHATWAAVSLRDQDGKLVSYVHIGGGQQLFDAARAALGGEAGEIAGPPGVDLEWAVAHTGVVVQAKSK